MYRRMETQKRLKLDRQDGYASLGNKVNRRCDEGVELLPPLYLRKRSGIVVLERAEGVTSCLKKYAKAYDRGSG